MLREQISQRNLNSHLSLSHQNINPSNPRLSVSNNIDVLRDKLFTAISGIKGEKIGKVRQSFSE